ncbi:MAG: class I SAM-dependent methyltransferase [Spirochaetes bacterium]|nr:class I SAM-dependent methyltransferase [Spirochaetota bacterium]
MKQASKFWDRMAGHYDSMYDKKYWKAYQDTIEISRKHLSPRHTSLDIACGTGITVVELAASVRHIAAIDISERMIEIARKKSRDRGIENVDFAVTDIFDARFDDTRFDVVFANNILHFFPDTERALGRIRELLHPGGIFISATDCLGEKRSVIAALMSFLSKLGIIPQMKRYRISELEDSITNHSFKIIERATVFDNPPNYVIVAKAET